MKRQARRLEVTAAFELAPGTHLQIGSGDDAELAEVRTSRGRTVRLGHAYWWHKAAYRVRRLRGQHWAWRRIAEKAAKEALCGLRRHRLTVVDIDAEDPDDVWRYCWCGKRWEDNGREGWR